MTRRERFLVLLLRLAGVSSCLAIVALQAGGRGPAHPAARPGEKMP